MARTKHRKDHNKAVAHRRLMAALERQELPPRPVKVGKNKFKVVGPDRPTTPEEIAALPEIRVTGTSRGVEDGDVVYVTNGEGKPFYARVTTEGHAGMQEIGLNGRRLRGKTANFLSIDDAAFYDGGKAPGTFEGCIKALVDGQEVPAKVLENGIVILDSAPPECSKVEIQGTVGTLSQLEGDYKHIEERLAAQLGLPLDVLQGRRAGMSITPAQERMIRDGKFLGVSMGATYDAVPMQGLDPKPLPGISGPYHLEMAISQGEDGKPRFEEISLCPGPDPNGITDLKDPE